MAVIVIPLEGHTLSASDAGCEAGLHRASACRTKPIVHIIRLQAYSSLFDNQYEFAETHNVRPVHSIVPSGILNNEKFHSEQDR
jgi:hypothetical protein